MSRGRSRGRVSMDMIYGNEDLLLAKCNRREKAERAPGYTNFGMPKVLWWDIYVLGGQEYQMSSTFASLPSSYC